MIPVLGDLIREAAGVVKELIPDADKKMEIGLKLAELADQAEAREVALMQGQIDINKVEAANPNLFVSGWRPGIGWVCSATLGWTWILAPLANWVASLAGAHVAVPALPAETSYPIVLALLGLGAQRSYERAKGVANSQQPSEMPGVVPNAPAKPKGRWF